MKFFLKLVFSSVAFVTGIAAADPIVPYGPRNDHARSSQEGRRSQPYGQWRTPMIRTGFSDQDRGYKHRSKRMSTDERFRLRNQIREAGRMDFYR